MTKKMVKATEVKTPETATEVKTTPEMAKKSAKATTKAEPKVEEVKTETTVETPVEVKTEETKPDFKKSKREELIGVLRTNFKAVKDESLKDSIKYTVKKAEKATLSDLRNLVREVKKALGKEFNETPTYIAKAEASLKKAEKVEPPVEEKSEPKAEPKKAKKKSTKDSDTVSEKAVQLATSVVFPEVIKEYDEEYHLAHDVKTLADLEKATENGDEVMIACLWTKRHLRQFRYFNGWLGQPKSFKNDLDLCQLIWCTSKVAYAVSNDTEAIYNFFPEDIVEEDGIRCCNGLEYQIYRKTGEVETEEPDDEEETEE